MGPGRISWDDIREMGMGPECESDLPINAISSTSSNIYISIMSDVKGVQLLGRSSSPSQSHHLLMLTLGYFRLSSTTQTVILSSHPFTLSIHTASPPFSSSHIISKEAITFLATLHRTFNAKRIELLKNREVVQTGLDEVSSERSEQKDRLGGWVGMTVEISLSRECSEQKDRFGWWVGWGGGWRWKLLSPASAASSNFVWQAQRVSLCPRAYRAYTCSLSESSEHSTYALLASGSDLLSHEHSERKSFREFTEVGTFTLLVYTSLGELYALSFVTEGERAIRPGSVSETFALSLRISRLLRMYLAILLPATVASRNLLSGM